MVKASKIEVDKTPVGSPIKDKGFRKRHDPKGHETHAHHAQLHCAAAALQRKESRGQYLMAKDMKQRKVLKKVAKEERAMLESKKKETKDN